MLKVGDKAPDVELLKDLYKKSKLVIFFYPKDFTPGCTKEACYFRDNYGDFKKLGAEVIGISKDSEKSHENFIKEYNLPYPLYSDKDGTIAKSFGVGKTLGFFSGRVTFVIDEEGICRLAFSSAISMEKHVEEALNAVKALP